jgi:hypothetical protein
VAWGLPGAVGASHDAQDAASTRLRAHALRPVSLRSVPLAPLVDRTMRTIFLPWDKSTVFATLAVFRVYKQPDPETEGADMDKAAMRAEAERLMREAMERKALVVKQGNTVIMAACGKCGATTKVTVPKGESRVEYACKECGVKQRAM